VQLVHTACAAFDKISTDIASRSSPEYKCVTEKKTLVSFIFVLMICTKDKLGINLFVIFYTVLLYNWLILRAYFYAKLMFSKIIIFADNFQQQRC